MSFTGLGGSEDTAAPGFPLVSGDENGRNKERAIFLLSSDVTSSDLPHVWVQAWRQLQAKCQTRTQRHLLGRRKCIFLFSYSRFNRSLQSVLWHLKNALLHNFSCNLKQFYAWKQTKFPKMCNLTLFGEWGYMSLEEWVFIPPVEFQHSPVSICSGINTSETTFTWMGNWF